MAAPEGLSEEDVSCLVQMHEGFVGIPDTLHAALCNKLVNGILDAGESLGINAEGNTCTLVPVAAGGDIWLCEHVFTFSTRDEVEANISELVGVCGIPEDCENVLQALLGKARVLESQHVSSPTTHFLCELWADHIESVSQEPSCSHCTIFSPLHGRHFSVLWPLRAHAAGARCSSLRAEGAFLALARGGNAHLHLVTQQSNRFASLLRLTPHTAPAELQQASAALIAEAAPEAKLSNVSPDPLRPMLFWEDFLTVEEHEFLRDVVYNEAAGGFGTQFVKEKPKESPPPVENQEESLSAETAKLVAQLVGDGSATRNRLRTSHFVRACWWAEGLGKEIRERISARAAKMLGLSEECAEAPQIVCYPGGATYFRAHHDSGRVEWLTQGSTADPPASVELDRDHYGAARVATVFVYLSSHVDGEGGATKVCNSPRRSLPLISSLQFGYLAGSDEG